MTPIAYDVRACNRRQIRALRSRCPRTEAQTASFWFAVALAAVSGASFVLTLAA